MKIELNEIKIRDIVRDYVDNAEEGVHGYGGKLDIRPKYQREFIYDDKKRNAVMDTIKKGFPLNVIYWVKNEDGSFEVLDGQQRTISFCQYVNGDFSLDSRAFGNLTKTEQEQILNYEVMVYFCEGNDKDKLDWFKTINIAGEKLTDQEMRNAVYSGEWVTDAKRHFSKSGCAAYNMASDYMSGSPIRQDYLETALEWIADKEKLDKVEDYMSKHQHDSNANELWLYFQSVISWVEATFPKKRKEMKSVPWGILFNRHGNDKLDTKKLETQVASLIMDDDVTKKSGVYEYILTGEEKALSIRAFTPAMKSAVYEKQKGFCKTCKKHFELGDMEADHIKPWHEGGKTTSENCQMLCKACNRRKGGK